MKKLLLLLTAVLWVGHLEAQISKVNVTIDGPGVVDEYLTLGANGTKQLKLKAVPSKFLGNVTFDGWSGDATGTSTELTVDANVAQNIHATFTYHRPVKQYPLLDLKQSWVDMGKPLYIEMPSLTESEAVGVGIWRAHSYLPVDYNRDGYLDYIQFPVKGPMGIDDHREKVRFWLGKADGTFEEDTKNDKKLDGTVYSIHIKYADFNNDGWPDFCSFSSGYDRNGSTYDYPVILMSNSATGVYSDIRYNTINDTKRYFHGGEVGDIDNDGDIDAIFLDTTFESEYDKSIVLLNDGNGNFTKKLLYEVIDLTTFKTRYNPAPESTPVHGDLNITDLNKDNYNDLIFTGTDVFKNDGSNYYCGPVVFWGSNTGTFGGTNYSLLPKCREGYSINEDFAFYDLNGDGIREIIVERNGDGRLGGTTFYRKGYLQVCELVNGQFVDKTDVYIPVENTAFNNSKSESSIWIEKVDGTDYLCAAWGGDYYNAGVGVGHRPIYAIRNGILVPVDGYATTKISSFDEGLPIYVDGLLLTDTRNYDDGVNPTDTLSGHGWGTGSTWDAVTGNMWRINLAHRENTHSGRTCIRWNRAGMNPSKTLERQAVDFTFISNVDISKLRDERYVVELYIKNTDADLTLNVNGVEIGANDTDEGHYTGQWQRMSFPLYRISDGPWTGIWIEVKEGNINNEFYLDDIRIRKLADAGTDDYDRAFLKNYVDADYWNKERTAQVKSQEFKTMLKKLIQEFAPESLDYFNSRISDYDVSLNRGLAACMAYYTARCIGAETKNTIPGEQPADMWDRVTTYYTDLLPHCNDSEYADPSEAPADKFWRGFTDWIAGWLWNENHVSDYSGVNVIALDKTANSFHMNDPLTWEDAIRAITRLYDSLDPATVASTVSTNFLTVSFDAAGGSPVPLSQSIIEGKKASMPTGLSRTGYELGGWTNGGVLYDFDSAVTSNLNLVARWKKLLSNGITIGAIDNQTYSGSTHSPAVTVKDGETDITDQCLFTFTNNVNAGTATVTISAKTESTGYSGQTSTTFSILPKAVSNPTVILSENNLVYNGAEQKPTVSQVKDGDVVIPAGEYAVSYSNNINAGTATVTVTGKDGGNYSFNGTASFTIAKAAGVISYDELTISKALGAADFTNTLKNTGDGTVSYTSSDEKVATIDASTAVVKILAGGVTVITATVADGNNYTYATKTAKYEVKVQDKAIDKNEPVSVNGATYYEPTKEFSDVIKEQINIEIALVADADSRTTVTKDGGLAFSQGSNIGMALLAQKTGNILRFEFEGKMYGDSQKMRQKVAGVRGTRAVGDMELVSGAEYEVVEAGDIVITMALADAPVTLKKIIVSKSTATAINSIEADESSDAVWHDLNGHVINGTPAKRGIYIKNGKKVVVK